VLAVELVVRLCGVVDVGAGVGASSSVASQEIKVRICLPSKTLDRIFANSTEYSHRKKRKKM
jgi:hypothetical protein